MRLIFVDNAEAVREIESLALGQMRQELGPLLFLACIGKQVLNDRSFGGRFFHRKQSFAGNPAILFGQIPAPSLFALANDDVDAVIFHIQRLAPSLNAIAKHSHRFLAENLLQALRGKVRTFGNGFSAIANLDLSHRISFQIALLLQGLRQHRFYGCKLPWATASTTDPN